MTKFYQLEVIPKITEEVTDQVIMEMTKNKNPIMLLYSPKQSNYR